MTTDCLRDNDTMTIITDTFFDDISAFLYYIGLSVPCNLVTTALGYSASDTARRISNGLVNWAQKNEIDFKNSHVSQQFYDSTDPRNNPFRSLIDLNFASNLGDHLCFFDYKDPGENKKFKYTKNILVLGPYSDLALTLCQENDRCHCQMNERCHCHINKKFTLWCSGSGLINSDAYTFPDVVYVGKGSNAGIDPTATLLVWRLANKFKTPILVSRQPPVQQVYETVKDIQTFAGRKLTKVLKYTIENNPGGIFVWDLGCAITQHHPDIIIQQQLYDADYSDNSFSAIKLTKTNHYDKNKSQVYVVNVNIEKMINYLILDLTE